MITIKEIKIYFESTKSDNQIFDYISNLYLGFTVYKKQVGYWKGNKETSNVVEIITNPTCEYKFYINLVNIKLYIKQIAKQEEVLITIKDVEIL